MYPVGLIGETTQSVDGENSSLASFFVASAHLLEFIGYFDATSPKLRTFGGLGMLRKKAGVLKLRFLG